jgi:hypothetical protein
MKWTSNKVKVAAACALVLIAGFTTALVKIAPDVAFNQQSRTRMYEAKQWALGIVMFADTHGNQYPSNFWRLAGTVNLSDLDWEIVSSGSLASANVSRTILLRGKGAEAVSPRRFRPGLCLC